MTNKKITTRQQTRSLHFGSWILFVGLSLFISLHNVSAHDGFDMIETIDCSLSIETSGHQIICTGESSQITVEVNGGSGNYQYFWSPPFYLNDPNSANPISSPNETIIYSLTVQDIDGCSVTSYIGIFVEECEDEHYCPEDVSSAHDGGLESNNVQFEKIADRFYEHKKDNNYKNDKSKQSAYKQISSGLKSIQVELEDFIPMEAMAHLECKESTPKDLENITNANRVFSVDFYDDDHRNCSLLAIETDGRVYEHTKGICDRLSGSRLKYLFPFDINEESFMVSQIIHENGSIEYNVNMSIWENAGQFVIENHWNLDKFSKDKKFYNFQFWGSSMDNVSQLVSSFLHNLKDIHSSVLFEKSDVPSIFIRRGIYKNGLLELEILNNTEQSKTKIKGLTRRSETDENFAIEYDINLIPFQINHIKLDIGYIYDFGFQLVDMENNGTDDLYLSDGVWGIDESDQNTEILGYTITSEDRMNQLNEKLIERNIQCEAIIGNSISFYRSMKAKFTPLDLSTFNHLSFKVQGKAKLEVKLIKDSIDEWSDQYSYSVILDGAIEEIDIPLFKFQSTVDDPIVMDDITMVVFTFHDEYESAESQSLIIQDLLFSNRDDEFVDAGLNQGDFKMFPNPTYSNIQIQYNSDHDFSSNLIITDAEGQIIQNIKREIVSGYNDIDLQTNDLITGTYNYTFYEKLVPVISGKFIKI